VTLRLEGALVGAWVKELRDCWQSALPGRVDLSGVTYVDAGGKELLADMHRQGIELIARGCMMRAIVAELM
jgi:hypothetical protein